jgi:5,10-methenyltetrahydromethanopterin hydrogenase
MVLDGIVVEWSNDQVALKSLSDEESFIIINQPATDIVVTKIIVKEPEKIKEKTLPEIKEKISETVKEVLKPDVEPDLHNMNIKHLRRLVQEQDKKIITEKRKEHFGEVGTSHMATPYSIPNIHKLIPKGK